MIPLIIIVALVVAGVAGWLIGRIYFRYRGTRLVTCPETHLAAAVEMDAARAAVAKVAGEGGVRLRSCSRWPERQDCGQECLAQVHAAPEDCRVAAIVRNWYRDKSCAYCGRRIEAEHWHDRAPALMSPDQITVRWNEVRPEQLPAIFETHHAVCWNCHIAESFRRIHPELVVDRPRYDEKR